MTTAHQFGQAHRNLIEQEQWVKRHRGFTLVEMMVVIGVIILLIALLFVGVQHAVYTSKVNDTKTTMQTMRSLIANYERTTHMSGPAPIYPPSTATWTGFVAAPTVSLSPDAGSIANIPLVIYTGNAMNLFMTIPENKALINAFPPSKVIRPFPGQSTPLILDGWGNPILLVPGAQIVNGSPIGGLTGVMTSGTANAGSITIQSPDLRPFWAATGPDGLLNRGDDNIYSFQ